MYRVDVAIELVSAYLCKFGDFFLLSDMLQSLLLMLKSSRFSLKQVLQLTLKFLCSRKWVMSSSLHSQKMSEITGCFSCEDSLTLKSVIGLNS